MDEGAIHLTHGDFDLESEQAQTTEDPTVELVTCVEEQALFVEDVERSSACSMASSLPEIMHSRLIDTEQF